MSQVPRVVLLLKGEPTMTAVTKRSNFKTFIQKQYPLTKIPQELSVGKTSFKVGDVISIRSINYGTDGRLSGVIRAVNEESFNVWWGALGFATNYSKASAEVGDFRLESRP
jgi:hypothetical protein